MGARASSSADRTGLACCPRRCVHRFGPHGRLALHHAHAPADHRLDGCPLPRSGNGTAATPPTGGRVDARRSDGPAGGVDARRIRAGFSTGNRRHSPQLDLGRAAGSLARHADADGADPVEQFLRRHEAPAARTRKRPRAAGDARHLTRDAWPTLEPFARLVTRVARSVGGPLHAAERRGVSLEFPLAAATASGARPRGGRGLVDGGRHHGAGEQLAALRWPGGRGHRHRLPRPLRLVAPGVRPACPRSRTHCRGLGWPRRCCSRPAGGAGLAAGGRCRGGSPLTLSPRSPKPRRSRFSVRRVVSRCGATRP